MIYETVISHNLTFMLFLGKLRQSAARAAGFHKEICMKCTIGLDFGTQSARGVLVDADSGSIIQTAVAE